MQSNDFHSNKAASTLQAAASHRTPIVHKGRLHGYCEPQDQKVESWHCGEGTELTTAFSLENGKVTSSSTLLKMPSFLKKGRAQNYALYTPAPPPRNERPQREMDSVSQKPSQLGPWESHPAVEQVTGRLMRSYPDSSRLIELTRADQGLFGLYFAKGSEKYHGGIYVVRLIANLPLGILGVGDEILEIDGRGVKDMGLDEVYSCLNHSNKIWLRTLPLKPSPE
nr:PREDICTED: uncharacterized protein LOC106702987 [Latimeria chalumnae]|eukprot:XP_014342281.1 PREDICTED: uncharacterized protein LOC106702987 [Latimeria chalumnae]